MILPEATPSHALVMEYWTQQIAALVLLWENHCESKTIALLLAAELLGSLQVYDYRKCISYISAGSGITWAEYETKDDYSRWQIDTSLTFRGKRCKTLNPDMLLSIFGRYSGDEPQVVHALMIKWIKDNREAFDKATFIGMISKDLELDSWLLNMCHGCGLAGRNSRNTFITAGVSTAVVRVGSSRLSVRYSDEYYFSLLDRHALTSPEGGRPCLLGTFYY